MSSSSTRLAKSRSKSKATGDLEDWSQAPRGSQDVPGRIGHDRSIMTHDQLMSGQVELFWYLQIGLPPVSMIVIVSIATIVGYIILSYPIVGQPI